MSSFAAPFQAVDLQSGKHYHAATIEEFKATVEAGLGDISLPPDYRFQWEMPKCIKWLVEVGYILPVSGPEWFMRLRKDLMESAPVPQEDVKSGELRVVDLSSEQRVLILLQDESHGGVHTEFSLTLEEARFLRDELNAIPSL